MLQKIYLFTILCICSLSNSSSYAQHSLDELKVLNLTSIQQQSIGQIQNTFNPQLSKLENTLKQKQQVLNKSLQTGEFTDNSLLILKDEVNQLQSQIANLEIKYWLEVKKVLDKDQRYYFRKHF